jgi:hypothetical protein
MPTGRFIAVSSAAVAAVAFLSAPGAIAQVAQNSYVLINGKTDPSAIPDYQAWRATFHTLSAIDRGLLIPIKERLNFPPADAERIYAQARLQKIRDDQCYEQQHRAKDALGANVKPEKLLAELDKVVLGCRQQVLDVSDQLLASLSPEARLILLGFVEEKRGTVEVMVEKRRLEFFRLPR